VLIRFSSLILLIVLFVAFANAQTDEAARDKTEPAPTPSPIKNNGKDNAGQITAEQVAESCIIVYGFGGGRALLDRIRKTTLEHGKTTVADAAGTLDTAAYTRYIIRGDALSKDKVRVQQEFPNARYSLVWDGEKTFGVFNNATFAPRQDAVRTFEDQIFRGLDGLLRFKEDGSKLDLVGKDKHLGVEFYVVDVTDTKGRVTRYYISVKTYRVMMLTYEDGGVKYQRKFYDYRYAQGTLVPYRTVLTANDKTVEESEVGTITFGPKIDDDLFRGQ